MRALAAAERQAVGRQLFNVLLKRKLAAVVEYQLNNTRLGACDSGTIRPSPRRAQYLNSYDQASSQYLAEYYTTAPKPTFVASICFPPSLPALYQQHTAHPACVVESLPLESADRYRHAAAERPTAL